LCSSKKYPYPPNRRDWNFPSRWGFSKNKEFKEMYEALLEIPKGWGGGGILDKISSVGRYGYFLGLHLELTTKMILELLFWCCFVW